jgi:release factor glutamine methyltransferase
MTTVAEALAEGKKKLSGVTETASLDIQVLLAHIIGKRKEHLLAHPESTLTEKENGDFLKSLQRLEGGEPLPYVLGEWEFFGLTFKVTPAVLIPRPETELLVETAIAWLEANPGRRRAVDVGTGSGCIAVSLAKHVSDLHIEAIDISQEALAVARANVEAHGVGEQVKLIEADLLSPIQGRIDLICANLPYLPHNRLQTLEVYKYEPEAALVGGADGLAFIRRLLEQAPAMLAPGGLILLEIDAEQGDAVKKLAAGAFPSTEIEVLPDLAGHPRVVSIAS